jgi:hypothetical protein
LTARLARGWSIAPLLSKDPPASKDLGTGPTAFGHDVVLDRANTFEDESSERLIGEVVESFGAGNS